MNDSYDRGHVQGELFPAMPAEPYLEVSVKRVRTLSGHSIWAWHIVTHSESPNHARASAGRWGPFTSIDERTEDLRRLFESYQVAVTEHDRHQLTGERSDLDTQLHALHQGLDRR